jgi:hypothetical protein
MKLNPIRLGLLAVIVSCASVQPPEPNSAIRPQETASPAAAPVVPAIAPDIVIRVQDRSVLLGDAVVDTLPALAHPMRVVGLFDQIMAIRKNRGLGVGQPFPRPAELFVAPAIGGTEFQSVYWTLAYAGFSQIAISFGERRYQTRAWAVRPCKAPTAASYLEINHDRWRLHERLDEQGKIASEALSSDGELESVSAFRDAARRLTSPHQPLVVHAHRLISGSRLEAFLSAIADSSDRDGPKPSVILSLIQSDELIGDATGPCGEG